MGSKGLQNEQSGLKPWLAGALHCVLGQQALLLSDIVYHPYNNKMNRTPL